MGKGMSAFHSTLLKMQIKACIFVLLRFSKLLIFLVELSSIPSLPVAS